MSVEDKYKDYPFPLKINIWETFLLILWINLVGIWTTDPRWTCNNIINSRLAFSVNRRTICENLVPNESIN